MAYDPMLREEFELAVFEARQRADQEVVGEDRGRLSQFFSYSISQDKTSVDEGDTVTFTLAINNIANGTILYWTTAGTATAQDFTDQVSSGNFILNGSSQIITRSISVDFTTEGTETFSLELRTGSLTGPVVAASPTIIINDTSTPSNSSAYLVNTLGSTRNSTSLLFGFNYGATSPSGVVNTIWSDPQFYTILDELSTTLIRYPGGTGSNYWNWQTGTFETSYDSTTITLPWSQVSYYDSVISPRSIDTIWVVNMLTRTSADQLNYLTDTNDTYGMPIKYVELGNEFYLTDASYLAKYPTAEDYALDTISWLPTLRSGFPNAKYAVTGALSAGSAVNRRNTWNEKITAIYTDAVQNPGSVLPDAITLHSYQRPTASSYQAIELWLTTSLESEITRIANEISSIYLNLGTQGDDIKIWITEYNIIDDFNEVSGTWAHALYVLAMQFKMMEFNEVEMTILHSQYAGRNFGMFWHTNYAFNTGGTSDLFDYSATGLLMKLFGPAYANCESYQSLDLPSSNLLGKAFYSASSPYSDEFIFINLTTSDYPLDLTNMLLGRTIDTVEEYYADPTLLVNKKETNGTKGFPNVSVSAIADITNYTMRKFQVTRIKCQYPQNQVDFANNSRSTNEYVFGYNPGGQTTPYSFNGAWSKMWVNSSYLDRLNDLGMEITHYPGGTTMNYWDWQNETYITALEYANVPSAYLGTSSVGPLPTTPGSSLATFKSLSDNVGFTTIWCLNVYTRGAVDQVNFLNTVISNSFAVDYVELGEEFYLASNTASTPDTVGYVVKYPTGADYGIEMVAYVDAIRANLGTANSRIGIVGATLSGGNTMSRRNTWNTVSIPAFVNESNNNSIGNLFDAVTIHSYLEVDQTDYADLTNWLLTTPAQQYQKIVDSIANIDTVFTEYVNNSVPLYFPTTDSAYPEIWLTGYNIQDDTNLTLYPNSAISGTWAHGLYLLALHFLIMENTRMTVVLGHSITASRQYGMFFNVPNGFGSATTDLYDLSAAGMIMTIIGPVTKEATYFESLTFDTSTPTTNVSLFGKRFVTPSGDRFIIANLSPTAYTVDLLIILAGQTTTSVREVVANPTLQINKKVSGSKQLPTEIVYTTIADPGVYTIQPYQVTYIECV